jgi:hypothetical protein
MRGIGRVGAVCLIVLLCSAPAAWAAWAFDTIPSNGPVEPPADAIGSATYTFESPTFTAGTATPMLNRAPNSSSVVGFLASFTAAPNPTEFSISALAHNALITGQSLIDLGPTISSLTITFNQPVQSLSFVFATNSAQGGTGHLDLASTSGNQSQTSANVGGGFPGGTFNFSPATPFNSVTLSAYSSTGTGTPTQLDIDNLTLNIVPEPASLGLVVIGLAALRRRARRQLAKE